MRHLLTPLLTLLLCLPGLARGQDLSTGEAKPLVTVSFSGYEELQKDTAYLGQLLNNPRMGDLLDSVITAGTAGQGLASVDPTRPWGVSVQVLGEQFPVLGFVPVKDVDKFIDLLRALEIQVTDEGDGSYSVVTPARPLAMRYRDGWVYLADKAERLEQLPADPVQGLGSLPKKYDLAVLVHVANLPKSVRQMLKANLGMGAAMAAQRQPGETDEQFAMRKLATQNSIEQINRMLEQLDKLLLGLAVKRKAGTGMIDVAISARTGTDLAGQFATMAEAKTDFFGFADDTAAAWGNWSRTLTEADIAQVKSYLAQAQKNAEAALKEQELSDEELQTAQDMLAELFTIINENLEAKKSDGGFAVYAGADRLTVTGGGSLADGPKLEKLVKDFVEQLAAEQPDIRDLVKLDAETHQGVNFHVVSVPAQKFEDEAERVARLLGDPVRAIVGFGPKSIYLAAGKDASSTLKGIIDDCQADRGKEVSPGKVVVKLTPIIEAVANTAENPQTKQIAQGLAAAVGQAGSKDRLIVETRPIPSGAMTRITLEEGVLRAVGVGVQQGIQAVQQGFRQPQPIQPAQPGGGF